MLGHNVYIVLMSHRCIALVFADALATLAGVASPASAAGGGSPGATLDARSVLLVQYLRHYPTDVPVVHALPWLAVEAAMAAPAGAEDGDMVLAGSALTAAPLAEAAPGAQGEAAQLGALTQALAVAAFGKDAGSAASPPLQPAARAGRSRAAELQRLAPAAIPLHLPCVVAWSCTFGLLDIVRQFRALALGLPSTAALV